MKSYSLMLRNFCFLAGFILCTTIASAQESAIVTNDLQNRVAKGELKASDAADWTITSEHVSSTSGAHHVYYRQQVDGIQIYGAEASVHKSKEGKILASHNSFINNAVRSSRSPQITPLQAIQYAANHLNLGSPNTRIISTSNDVSRATILEATSISRSQIPAKLMYNYSEKEGLRLAWDLSIEAKATVNWWNVRIDATTGELLDKVDWTVQCSGGDDHVHDLSSAPKVSAAIEDTSCIEDDATTFVGNYEVYAMPLESPAHGTMNSGYAIKKWTLG